MSHTETYIQSSAIETRNLHDEAATFDAHARLPEDDTLNATLFAAGITGEAILDIEAGTQRFAVIDAPEAGSIITGVGIKTYTPFAEQTQVGNKSPREYELEEANPYILIHLAQDGTVTGRAIRRGEPIFIGRQASSHDKKSDRFEYEDDLELSRLHMSIELDAGGNQLRVGDLESTNGTILRSSTGHSEYSGTTKTAEATTDENNTAPQLVNF